MATTKIKYFWLLFIVFSVGCKEEFSLGTKTYERLLVVEGVITNEPGAYSVTLFKSSPVNDTTKIPYTGCKVSINDSTGYSEVLTEYKSGKYTTSTTGIQGKIGDKYSISIVTPDGKEYRTEFQELKEPVGVDSIYAEISYQALTVWPFSIPGLQFYVDTKIAPNQTYFLWNMIETYTYASDYLIWGVFHRDYFEDPHAGVWVNNRDTIFKYDSLTRCWKTKKSNAFFTGKTSNLSESKITRQPLHFVSTETKRLTDRYSLLLKQFTIGKEAYYFWKSVNDQTSDKNFLISKQPFNIVGNVKNINDASEPVLGYFTVASVAQKRVFINRPSVYNYFKPCRVDYDWGGATRVGHFFLVKTEVGIGEVSEYCLDCTLEEGGGGVTKKPSFWLYSHEMP